MFLIAINHRKCFIDGQQIFLVSDCKGLGKHANNSIYCYFQLPVRILYML